MHAPEHRGIRDGVVRDERRWGQVQPEEEEEERDGHARERPFYIVGFGCVCMCVDLSSAGMLTPRV